MLIYFESACNKLIIQHTLIGKSHKKNIYFFTKRTYNVKMIKRCFIKEINNNYILIYKYII